MVEWIPTLASLLRDDPSVRCLECGLGVNVAKGDAHERRLVSVHREECHAENVVGHLFAEGAFLDVHHSSRIGMEPIVHTQCGMTVYAASQWCLEGDLGFDVAKGNAHEGGLILVHRADGEAEDVVGHLYTERAFLHVHANAIAELSV